MPETHRMPRSYVLQAVLVLIVVLVGASNVAARDSRQGPRSQASGETPFRERSRESGTCGGAFGYATEPMVASHPNEPDRLIAVWRQDQHEVGALGVVSSVSSDGGQTWHQVMVPGLTKCSDGPADHVGASDPWLAIGPDGTAYLTAMAFTSQFWAMGLLGYHSTDGGLTWQGPSTIAPADRFLDRPIVTADPDTPGVAYVTWNQGDGNGDAWTGGSAIVMSRTTDGGETWSPPVEVDKAPAGYVNGSSQLFEAPDGALVVIFTRVTLRAAVSVADSGEGEIFAARSTDGGATWSTTRAARYVLTSPVAVDPERNGYVFGARPFVAQAMAPDGSIFVTWGNNASPNRGRVYVMRSADGGVSWSEPKAIVKLDAQVLIPSIAVARDGTVGVSYADLRNDDSLFEPNDRELTADWWFAHSHDGGVSWEEEHLAGSFDLRLAEFTRGPDEGEGYYWLGEFFGVARMSNGFGTVYVMPQMPEDGITQTSVEFTRIKL